MPLSVFYNKRDDFRSDFLLLQKTMIREMPEFLLPVMLLPRLFRIKKKQQEGDPSVNMKKFGKNADSKVNKFKGGFHQPAGTR